MLRVLSLALLFVAPVSAGAVQDTRELMARDARVSFTRGAALRARTFLDPDSIQTPGSMPRALQLDASLEARAAALIALGGGGRRDVPLLESYAVSGREIERRAALFGLADMEESGLAALRRLARDQVHGFEGALVFAIDRSGRLDESEAGTARKLLERFVSSPTGKYGRTLAAKARRALAAGPTEVPGAARPLLELFWDLRWRAGREFGFIDGRRWRETQLEALYGNDEFLDRFVLRAASILDPASIRLHVMQMLGAGENGRPARAGVLRAVIETNPAGLNELFVSGSWAPATKRAWRAIVDQAFLVDRITTAEDLFNGALRADSRLYERAGILLLRGGHQPPTGWIERALERGAAETWLALYQWAGDSGEPDLIPRVQTMISLGTYPELDSAGSVALARLGHARSVDRIEGLMSRGPSPERTSAIAALARAPCDPKVLALLERALGLEDLSEFERTQIQLALASIGRWPDRAAIHIWLLSGSEPRTRATRVIRALSDSAKHDDVVVFRHLYPVDDDVDLNVELAFALFVKRDKEMLDILRAALWSPAIDRGILAAGVLAEFAGLRSLMDELDNPPRNVSDAALRRVGFAIGEWGGVPAVEELARRRSERDPGLQGALLGALAARGG